MSKWQTIFPDVPKIDWVLVGEALHWPRALSAVTAESEPRRSINSFRMFSTDQCHLQAQKCPLVFFQKKVFRALFSITKTW